jgi:glycerol-3-phosphate dehydrogenase (NAD(P)+)
MMEGMDAKRENEKYLPGVKLPDSVSVAFELSEALYGADTVIFAVPAQHFRSAAKNAAPCIGREALIMNVAKGIETDSLKTISRIAAEIFPSRRFATLSGPSHAEEVGLALPTTVVAASEDMEVAEYAQDLFMTGRFRVYTNNDVIGVELGGALKNIIALGAGISDGMGFGDNAKAAMMTRGMIEIARLGEKLGGHRETFFGLAGIGDLIVTCTSGHSRNRRCGILIGQGVPPAEAVSSIGMVVEGVYTTEAAYRLAQENGIEMPITEHIYKVLKGEIEARDAVSALMTRQKRHETEELLQ